MATKARPSLRSPPLWVAIAAALALSGCVDRWLVIRSEPSGARVFIDGRERGVTPHREPFHFYGTREILLRLEDPEDAGGPSYRSESRQVEVKPPWYQRFPIDLFAEHLWPGTLVDTHSVEFHLKPLDAGALREELLEEAERRGIAIPRIGEPEEAGAGDEPR
ncbi:MAG: PEGA domain-containing protein [Planctomycetota bacterium]